MIKPNRKVQRRSFVEPKPPFAKQIKQRADRLFLKGDVIVTLALMIGGEAFLWLIPLKITTGGYATLLIVCITVAILLFIAGRLLCGRSHRINCLNNSLYVTGCVSDEIADL